MKPSLWLIAVNLFLVYISWGSTYIGLKFTLEVLGPFTTCGAHMGLGQRPCPHLLRDPLLAAGLPRHAETHRQVTLSKGQTPGITVALPGSPTARVMPECITV